MKIIPVLHPSEDFRSAENARDHGPKNEEASLGTARDQVIAKKLRRSVGSVRSRRHHETKVKFIRRPRRWTEAELKMFGTLSDAEIARRSSNALDSQEQTSGTWD